MTKNKECIIPWEISYFEEGVYYAYYVQVVYARNEKSARRIFKRENPYTECDIVEPKQDITYNDLAEIISKMTAKERKQSVVLFNEETEQEGMVCYPQYFDGELKLSIWMEDLPEYEED